MTVIGLDLSLTCVGICLPDGTTDHIAGTTGTLYERADHLRHNLRGATGWLTSADLVAIEDIGTQYVRTAIGMAYVHCMVDGMLTGTRVIKIAPALLKKWATGKGNADKHAMTVAAIRNGWPCDGDEGSTNDEADAWWLWTIGKAIVGEPVAPETEYRAALMPRWVP